MATTVEAVPGASSHSMHAQPAVAPQISRSIFPWAIWGTLWVFIACLAWGKWIVSGELFGPVPILEGDTMAPWRLIALRALELFSVLVLLVITWRSLMQPWLERREFGLDAMLLLGGIIGFSADALLNLHELLFAFNAHSVNLGVWTSFMPFYTDGPSRYAESLLWGFPMYVYFGIGASYAGCGVIAGLRARYPGISNAAAFAVAYMVFVISDCLLENAIIRTTEAYMFTKTYGPLTIFAGSIYQFPLYEALLASVVCLGFTAIRQSALDSADGLSFVERGAAVINPRYRTAVRTVAVIGAAGALFIFGYHLAFNWLGLIGNSIVEMPSYMYPA
jgi:Spirocyclase AveC-like